MRRRWSLFLFAVLAGFLSLPTPGVRAGGRIAVLLPESGSFTPIGALQQRGYNLAESQLRQQDREVQVRYFDTGSPGDVRDLIFQQVMPWKPDVVVGPYDSRTAISATRALAELEVPLIIPTAMLDELTQQPHPHVFRVATPLQILCLIAADFLATQRAEWGFDQVMLLGDQSLLDEDASRKLSGALAMKGLGPTAVTVYPRGSPLLNLEVSERTVLVVISYSPDDCVRLINRYGSKCRLVGFLIAFAAPEVRDHVGSLPPGSYRGVYCLVPWQEFRAGPASAAFVQQYRAKYQAPADPGRPDYHAAQAYSSLLVAGAAIAAADRNGTTVTAELRRSGTTTPLGLVRFIDYVDYYQQNPGSAAVLKYGPGVPEVVYPFDRVLRDVEETQPEPAGRLPTASPLRLLLDNQMIALFVVLSLGLLVGQIKVKGIALGLVGIFVVGIPLGYLGYTTPEAVGTLGVIFLLYGVGLGAGPTFFRAFGAYGRPLLFVLGTMILAGALATIAFVVLARVPADLAVGVFTGSMKSSSGFASAIDRLPGRTDVIALGYAVSYPISLLAIVLAVQLAPRLLRQDIAALNEQMAERGPMRRKVGQVMVELINPAVMGRRLTDLEFVAASGCRISRVLDGDRLVPAGPDQTARPGLHVQVLGDEASFPAVTDYLGRRSEQRAVVAADYQQAEIVLTSPRVAGRLLGELNPLVTHGVQVLEVTRLGHTFVPRDDLVLQQRDVLVTAGPAENLKEFARAAGNRSKVLQQTDMLSLAVGITLGVIVGTVPIGLPGGKGFVLGMAGGPMLVALLLGHFGRVGGIVGHFPPATQLFLVRLGLTLLLASASVKAGAALGGAVGSYGPVLLGMSVAVSVAALGAGLLVSYFWLRQNLLETLSVVSGGLNATPAYETLAVQANSDIVLGLFTTAYAVAMILTVLSTQLLIAVLLAV